MPDADDIGTHARRLVDCMAACFLADRRPTPADLRVATDFGIAAAEQGASLNDVLQHVHEAADATRALVHQARPPTLGAALESGAEAGDAWEAATTDFIQAATTGHFAHAVCAGAQQDGQLNSVRGVLVALSDSQQETTADPVSPPSERDGQPSHRP